MAPGEASKRDVPVNLLQLFTKLPRELQASLVSATTCPIAVLACASKAWRAAAVEHVQEHGASIGLQLVCDKNSPQEQRDKEVERLVSLAAWLWQKGHLLSGLTIQVTHLDKKSQEVNAARNSAIAAVTQVLATAGRRPGGLRLQRLCLPALGNTPLPTICGTLAGCRQLRQLELGYAEGPDKLTSSRETFQQQLSAALAQLTQLTSLTLHGALLAYYRTPTNGQVNRPLDAICAAFPANLVELKLGSSQGLGRVLWADLSFTTLCHLVNLQRLTLDHHIITLAPTSSNSSGGGGGGSGPAHPAALTALTSLDYPRALHDASQWYDSDAYPFLQLPNLVELRAGDWERADSTALEVLAARAAHTLRSLACKLSTWYGTSDGPHLAQLTRLTSLWVRCTPDINRGDVPGAQAWCDAISSLTGLQSLSITATLLQQLDLSPLTALTHLELHVACGAKGTKVYTRQVLVQLMERLQPLAGGALKEVEVVGVRAAWHKACRAAVVAAVGAQVALVLS